MACCQRNAGMGPDSLSLIHEKLAQIVSILPGSNYACVLGPGGDVLVQTPERDVEQGDLPMAISSLKLAAVQFASHLNQGDCWAIHLSGDSSMFSCYEVGENLLATFRESQLDTFGAQRKDDELREVIADLKLLLQNAATA